MLRSQQRDVDCLRNRMEGPELAAPREQRRWRYKLSVPLHYGASALYCVTDAEEKTNRHAI